MSTCSHCWNHGHNVRGCPKRKAEVKRLIAKGNTDHYMVRKQRRYDEVKRTRACSYCREPGHTRRTCPEFSLHKRKFIAINVAFRRKFVEDMKTRGLGIGSLIKMKSSYRDENWDRQEMELVYLVTEVKWDNVNWIDAIDRYTSAHCLQITSVSNHPTKNKPWVVNANYPAAEGLNVAKIEWERNPYQIVGTVSASAIESCVPHDFKRGKTGNDSFFNKETTRDWASSWLNNEFTQLRADGLDYLPNKI